MFRDTRPHVWLSKVGPDRMRPVLPLLGMVGLLMLAGCTGPCDRIDAQLNQLNADTIRDPSIATDGRYVAQFQELAAQSVERGCLSPDAR